MAAGTSEARLLTMASGEGGTGTDRSRTSSTAESMTLLLRCTDWRIRNGQQTFPQPLDGPENVPYLFFVRLPFSSQHAYEGAQLMLRQAGRKSESAGYRVRPQEPRSLIGSHRGDRFEEAALETILRPMNGRGAATNRSGRFEAEQRAPVDDGWGGLEELEALRTDVTIER